MKTSSIRHPENSIYLEVYEWMFVLCKGNQCAAMLLGCFADWHDYKMRQDRIYQRYNKNAQEPGDARLQDRNAYLFFSLDELAAELMGIFDKKVINEALDFLVSIDIISIHRNPNPRYYFDKTKYFVFHAHVCNRWISEHYSVEAEQKSDRPWPSIGHVMD